MVTCQAVLIGANGKFIRKENITIPALTKIDNGDFLVSRYQSSPFQLTLLHGRAKIPAGEYSFNCGNFYMNDMSCLCNTNHAFTVKLPRVTTIYVTSRTNVHDHMPTENEEYFHFQPNDIIVKGATIALHPRYDTNMVNSDVDGFYVVILD